MHQHIDRRLQIVSAGAGYGKTTLLIDFAEDVEIPICWYSLDRFDSDPKVFLETLVAAIAHKFPLFGEEARKRIATIADIKQQMPSLVGLLTAEIYRDIPEYFAVVLDDYHQVEHNPALNSLLQYLLDRLPENCQLILCSRSALPVPSVPRMLSQQKAFILGNEDLRFTAEETRELFLLKYGVSLSQDDAQHLNAQCEGWVTALQLIVATSGSGKFTAERPVESGHLFDYLSNEVYLRQSPMVRRFLLDTSILSELEPVGCERLLGIKGSKRILRYIDRANLFVVRVGEDGRTYRYHQLFQDFLQRKLMDDSARYVSLALKAARFYERKRNWGAALECYQRCGRWKYYVGIISRIGEELVAQGRWETLAHWIDAIPSMHLTQDPRLLIWRAQAAMRLGEMEKALSLSSQAWKEFELQGIAAGMAHAALVRAAPLRLAGQWKAALKDVRVALQLLRLDRAHPRLVAEARRQLGHIRYQSGQFERARKEWERSLALFIKLGDLDSISKLHDLIGVAYAELGDFLCAMDHLEQARAGWQKLGNLGDLGQTLNNLGNLLYLQGSYSEALTRFKKAVEVDRQAGNLLFEAWSLWNIGDVHRDLRDYEVALDHYQRSLELARQSMDSELVGHVTCGIGSLYSLLGRYEEGETLIRQAISHARQRGSQYEVGLFTGSLGALYCSWGKRKRALRLLAEAVQLISRSQNKRKDAWARLHLANALFLSKAFPECVQELKKVAAILDEVGFDAFLIPDASRMLPLVRYAASKRVGNGRFQEVWHKVVEPKLAPSSVARDNAVPDRAKPLPRVEAFALGESSVLVDSRKVSDLEWRSRKSKEMFFYLLSHRREATKEQILETLWPEVASPRGHSSVHAAAYRLRRALYDGCLAQEGGRYYLCPDGEFWFDAEEFDRLASQASRLPRGTEARASLMEKALELYRGPFLEEFYSEWCETLRRNAEQRYIAILSSLAGYYAALGDYPRSIGLLERIVGIDNYQEEAYAQLMKCYASMGDTTAALKWYERYRSLAQQDLQLLPSDTLATLYREIKESALKRS